MTGLIPIIPLMPIPEYYILQEGDTVQRGDEQYLELSKRWELAYDYGNQVTKGSSKYRRIIKND